MGSRMLNIASPMPQIRAKFTNKLGIPLSGCKVYTYEPNSDIPKTTWLNIDKTVENTNPILLDSAGEADIFLDGLYRIVVKDRFGFVVYDVEKTGTHTEWDASFVVDASGLTQQELNTGVLSLSELNSIENPKDGSRVFVSDSASYFVYKNNTWKPSDQLTINLKDYPRLDGEVDDTGRFERAINAVQYFYGSSPAGYAIYATTQILIPSGTYNISDEINLPSFVSSIEGLGKAIIQQTDPTKNIIAHYDIWSLEVKNIKFVGGKHHIYVSNENRDATLCFIDNCEFYWSADYAIKSWGTWATDPHMSLHMTINNPKFMYTNGAVYNVGDSCTIQGGWCHTDKSNFVENKAVFVNRYGNINTNGILCVPTFGTGADRLDRVRWFDNHGRLQILHSRFGGEEHGIPIVYTFAPDPWLADNMGASVVIRDSQTYGGIGYLYPPSGACVIYLDEYVPQHIILEGNTYQLACPYIACNPLLDLDAFFASQTDVAKRYRFKIDTNMTWVEDSNGLPYPQQLARYMNGGTTDTKIYPVQELSRNLNTSTRTLTVKYQIPSGVTGFVGLLSFSGNPAAGGSSQYRRASSYLVSMSTFWGGSGVISKVYTQELFNPKEGNETPVELIETYVKFSNGQPTQSADSSGTTIEVEFFNVTAYAESTFLLLASG